MIQIYLKVSYYFIKIEITFDESDDKTIKLLDSSANYSRLVNLKGDDLINERKRFLKLN